MTDLASSPSPPLPSRRRFLRWLLGGSLTLTVVAMVRASWRFLAPPLTSPVPAPVPAPEAASLRPGGRLYVAPARAYLERDEAGYFAVSAVCTHLGCLVHQVPEGFRCPCHGSRFDAEGRNLSGPARRPLDHLSLSVDDAGQMVVEPGRTTSPAARLNH
ncbi:MAG: ubiquinol-cytochrome c reductase iron-sulfur subunit [Anaerolineae bacterium]